MDETDLSVCFQPTTAQRCRSETEKFVLEDLFSAVLSKFKKYQPSKNVKFHNLGFFQSLKLCNLMGKILRISLKLNFTPNTLGCYGLNYTRTEEWPDLSIAKAISNINRYVSLFPHQCHFPKSKPTDFCS